MVALTSVLCPIDFSDFSRDALVHAAVLAGWYDGRITALHVYAGRVPVSPPTIPAALPILPPVDPDEIAERVRAFCVGIAPQPARRLEIAVVEGDPAREILSGAETGGASLIVMGTHGRGGFQRLVLGSVTEKVLRRSEVPVLVVPPRSEAAASALYKTILCATDFSDASIRALEMALVLAREADARLILLHVVEAHMDELGAEASRFTVAEYVRHRQEQARARLEAAVPDDARTWCTPEVRVAPGRASREIERMAAAEGAELIVMGVHGRGALDRWLFGSTTDYVVRHAACPVLTVRT